MTKKKKKNKKKYPGESCSGNSCQISNTDDYFQYFVFDYKTGNMLANRYSIETNGFGQGTGASLLDVNRAITTNGAESVKILGAHSHFNNNNQWDIGIHDISANDGNLSGLGIKYNSGSYFTNRDFH